MEASCSLSFDAEQAAAFDRIAHLIEGAQEIVICAHTNPDGDALGTQLALERAIRARWPYKQVTGLLADDQPVPRIYRFLPGAEGLVPAVDYAGTPDLFISVDLSVAHRLEDGEAVLERSRHACIIDHHPCDDPFGEAWYIRPSAAAASVLVEEFIQHLGLPLTRDIALCLLCGIITDTGRFQYQNADAEALVAASLLVQAGADPSVVSLNVYQSFRLEFLHLKAAVMARVVTFAHGRIAYSYATAADLERTGASLDEADGLALFLKEIPGGKVRGNLRSKTGIDISGVARELGGGGHKAAAGFTVEGDVDEVLSITLPKLRALFPEGVAQQGGTTSFPRIDLS